MRLLHTMLGAAVLALAVPAAHAANVKVGVILTYSGVNAEYGDQITRAMELHRAGDLVAVLRVDARIRQDHANLHVGRVRCRNRQRQHRRSQHRV